MEAAGVRIAVVVGMHRSGTSLCANMLHALGADMAEPGFNQGPANARGHWERPALVRMNDEIFGYFRRPWGAASHILTMPEHYLGDPRVQAMRQRAVEWLRPHLHQGRVFGFKDPRVSLLLPFWQQVFADLNAQPAYVFCVRNPAQVIRSVMQRDAMEPGQAEYRWLIYNAACIRFIGTQPVCIVPYEHWFETPLHLAARLAEHVGLAEPVAEAVRGVIGAELRHDAAEAQAPSVLAARLYRMILRNSLWPKLDTDLQGFVTLIDDFTAMVQPLLIGMELMRNGLADQKRVIGDLQGLVARQRAELAAARGVEAAVAAG